MKTNQLILMSLGLTLSFSACKKKEDTEPTITTGEYVLAATPGGSMGEGADYLISTNSLDEGTVSTSGNGIEQDGYRYYTIHKNRVFSLLYGQGNPGDVATYKLNADGQLTLQSRLLTESVHVFGTVDDDILLIKVPRSGTAEASNAAFYRINAENPEIVGTKQINTAQLAGNGERAFFTGAFQVGNKVYAPYRCIKGITGGQFNTDLTDSTWVAVFSYPTLELEKVIKDNRTSFIGYYFAQNGLRQIENGDVYAFSNSYLASAGVVGSTKPSAAIRIKSGETEFDQSYFFNIEQASGGHHVYNEVYYGNGKFLLTMFANANSTTGTKRFAIVDVFSQTFTWVTGMPEPANMLHISRRPHLSKDKQNISYGITTAEGTWIYRINVNTAAATKGLKVEAGSVTMLAELEK